MSQENDNPKNRERGNKETRGKSQQTSHLACSMNTGEVERIARVKPSKLRRRKNKVAYLIEMYEKAVAA